MARNSKLKITQLDVLKDRDRVTYFMLLKSDNEAFLRQSSIIRKYIDDKRPIPLAVFNKLINFFIPIEPELDKIYTSKFLLKVSELRERFLNDKKYEFSHKDRNTGHEYCLSEMLDDCLHSALGQDFLDRPEKKDYCLKLCYQTMKEYLSKLPVKHQKFMVHYKLSAISGFVLILLGHRINDAITDTIENGELPTNEELSRAVDYTTKKFEIKKRK